MNKKIVDLELAREFLGKPKPELSAAEKKIASSEKKKLKEYRETHPIEIDIAFEQPDWN